MKLSIFGLLGSTLLLASFANSSETAQEAQTLEAKNLTEQRQVHKQPGNPSLDHLYKIVSNQQWEESLGQSQVMNSPLDKDFIHLATEGQLPHIAQKFWNNKDLIILKLDSKKLTGRLVYEANPGGTTLYYHLYDGNIPLDAVVEVYQVRANNNQ